MSENDPTPASVPAPRRVRRPWFLTLLGIATIGGLIAMPILVGPPDGEQMPDWVRFTGRFHPMILHLPIGVFALILLQEIGAIFSRRVADRTRYQLFPLFFAAASAVLAVVLGFLLYQGGGYEENATAERHLWGGLVFSILAIVTFLVKAWTVAVAGKLAFFRTALFASVAVMGFTSHDGASMTHGSDYLTRYAPDSVRALLGLEPRPQRDPARPVEDYLVYQELVLPMFERTCVQCHGPDDSKGRLRMDTYALLVQGGREGSAIEHGSAERSNVIVRIEWPEDDLDYEEYRMPPSDRPQPTASEIAVLKWWLDSGASPEVRVGELAFDDEIAAALVEVTGAASAPAPAEEEATAAETAEAAPAGPDAELAATVEALAEQFPGAVSFESQGSSAVTFTAVSLRGNMDDAMFDQLRPILPQVVTLDLSATNVTDSSVAALSLARQLRMLRLAETQITDASLDTLANLPALESLNLYGTAVTDEGILKLKDMTWLRSLYLWQTEVSEEGVEELRDALPDCEIITGI